MKNLVMDIDKTLTLGDNKDYNLVSPNLKVINKVIEYKKNGFNIVLFTARNMRTHEGNIATIGNTFGASGGTLYGQATVQHYSKGGGALSQAKYNFVNIFSLATY